MKKADENLYRIAANGLLVCYLTLLVLGNFPIGIVRGLLQLTTLEQPWDVFAPEPVQSEVELQALLLFPDNSEMTWTPPRASPLLAIRSYHWELWARAVISGYRPLAQATAQWLARTYPVTNRPTQIILRRRWYGVDSPGTSRNPLWRETDFYIWSESSSKKNTNIGVKVLL